MSDEVVGRLRTANPTDDLLGTLPPSALRRVTAVLCLTEIVSWGVLFYAFPVIAPAIADETGWSTTSVVAAFTGSQLVAAGVGLVVGRWIHCHGPRLVMTLGSLVGVLGILAASSSMTLPTFVASWLLTGGAMAAVLYPPAFAALTGWGGIRRIQALTALTLVAGLASTVFAPLAAVLVDPLGWRDAYRVLAGILVITIPLHWCGLNHPWHWHRRDESTAPVTGAIPSGDSSQTAVWRSPPFLRLVASMSLVGLCIWSVVILVVPLLADRGFSIRAAAVALGIGGVGQVCGRLGYRRLSERTTVRTRTRIVFAAVAATTLSLALTPGPYALLAVLSFLAGSARGIYTLIQATAVADRWGTAQFATLNAVASGPLLVTGAMAPWLGTALAAGLGSQALTLVVLSGVAALAVIVVPRDAQHPREMT